MRGDPDPPPMSETKTTVPFGYLREQFADAERIFAELRALVVTGDYTLGRAVAEFEAAFAARLGVRHAIGVNSGTDALKLSLRALGIGPGDEVITAANTFIATAGAIADVGAATVFVDVDDSFCIDPAQVERAIAAKTKAIIPVHLTGNVADIARISEIAGRRGIPIVEDACQAFCSTLDGRYAGSWGATGTFSLHPQKFINIWGDGGVIVTGDDALSHRLRLLRNHGLQDRDTVVLLGVNSRLDTLQAIVARHVLETSDEIIRRRNENAAVYDAGFAPIAGVRVPPRNPRVRHTFVTYQLFAKDRNRLLAHCIANGIECKVHYPVPLYRQPGLAHLGYRPGAFPVTDRQAAEAITFPVHQHLARDQLDHAIETVRRFYGG